MLACDEQATEGEDHPPGQVGERRRWRDYGPQQPGQGGCGEVAERLHRGQQPERGAAHLFGSFGGDRRVLGGLDAADAEPGEQERYEE